MVSIQVLVFIWCLFRAQQEALDIFGVNAEELGALSDNEDDDEEEYDEDEEDLEEDYNEDENEEDDYTQTKMAKKRQKQLKLKHKIEEIFEPQELAKNLLTEFDQLVRLEDKPERFMLRTLAVTEEPDEAELEREARWIFAQAFQGKRTLSDQETPAPKQEDRYDEGKKASSPVVTKIKDVLNFVRNEFLEVPFIAFYRKEYIYTDVNKVNKSTDLELPDLWKIYEMDEKVGDSVRHKYWPFLDLN